MLPQSFPKTLQLDGLLHRSLVNELNCPCYHALPFVHWMSSPSPDPAGSKEVSNIPTGRRYCSADYHNAGCWLRKWATTYIVQARRAQRISSAPSSSTGLLSRQWRLLLATLLCSALLYRVSTDIGSRPEVCPRPNSLGPYRLLSHCSVPSISACDCRIW